MEWVIDLGLVLERALNGNGSAEDNATKWKGPNEETIEEDEEPSTPLPQQTSHRREVANGGTDAD